MTWLTIGILLSLAAFALFLCDASRRGFTDLLLVLVQTCAFVCLVTAAWPRSNGTEGNARERIATRPIETEENATERIGWTPTVDERYAAVTAAIGPPPTPDAVPVLGYETKGGAKYPPRWRTRPDGDRENNLKSQ